jgi:hypothetical protein
MADRELIASSVDRDASIRHLYSPEGGQVIEPGRQIIHRGGGQDAQVKFRIADAAAVLDVTRYPGATKPDFHPGV